MDGLKLQFLNHLLKCNCNASGDLTKADPKGEDVVEEKIQTYGDDKMVYCGASWVTTWGETTEGQRGSTQAGPARRQKGGSQLSSLTMEKDQTPRQPSRPVRPLAGTSWGRRLHSCTQRMLAPTRSASSAHAWCSRHALSPSSRESRAEVLLAVDGGAPRRRAGTGGARSGAPREQGEGGARRAPRGLRGGSAARCGTGRHRAQLPSLHPRSLSLLREFRPRFGKPNALGLHSGYMYVYIYVCVLCIHIYTLLYICPIYSKYTLFYLLLVLLKLLTHKIHRKQSFSS